MEVLIMTTIDDLLGLLEDAKKQFGGEFPIRFCDRNGESINPKFWDTISISRGQKVWEELIFVE